ncbi:hypothetical protein [Cochleicola gelatinilyticus]|uniref:Uncharacterized protein n=1 Tax=Cochleicola gelatinilyticus TaxID=1763537 RepID=A0A167IIP9_9FLAO|nr:hypothetical protein [Cochleicola gelatinilyticus]OAB79692.1 hypothetical protein ULVI_02795 [Cochleicola gelatinilyticus]
MKIFTYLSLFLYLNITFAQVGIGTTSPADGAALDISTNDQGILIPRVALTANNSLSAISLSGSTLTESTLVYNTATVTGANAVKPGFYYWNGSNRWIPLGDDWSLSGNNINASDFLGTTNAQPLVFKTSNNTKFTIPAGTSSQSKILSQGLGSESAPVYSFASSPNSGMYMHNATNLSLSSVGKRFISYDSFGASGGQVTINPDGDPDINFQVRSDSNVIISTHPTKINVEIGANNNPEYASLSLARNDQGFMPNRVILNNLSNFSPINSAPANGLLVWNNSTSSGPASANPKGMYFWDSRWKRMLTTDDLDHDWYEEGTTTQPNNINDNIVTNGAVGIGDTSIDASATLELTGANKGLLVNRVALTNASVAAPVTSPADGLLVYNTNRNLSPAGYRNDVRVGFYVWQNGRWIPQKNEDRSARFGNAANRTKNLNVTSGTELELFEFNEWNDDSNLFSVSEGPSATRLTINEDGRYTIHINVTIVAITTNQDLQLDTQLLINRGANTLYPGSTISNNYIKNVNNINTSSIIINETIEMQSGDQVYIYVERAGNSGTVRMRPEAGSNFFTISKVK